MIATLPQGWLRSTLSPVLAVLAHESGRGKPVYLEAVGRRTRIVVYRDDASEVECKDLRTACMLAAA